MSAETIPPSALDALLSLCRALRDADQVADEPITNNKTGWAKFDAAMTQRQLVIMDIRAWLEDYDREAEP